MEINFKANLINTTYVRKFSPSAEKFVPHEVSFVEINPRLKDDIKALKKLANHWGAKSMFANTIYKFAKSDPNKKTYLLTDQKTDFNKLDFTDILGIVQLGKEDNSNYCIEHLETKPDLQKSNSNRTYKRIGSRLLHCLKKVFYDKKLSVNYIFDEIEFYMNNGFDFKDEPFSDLIWEANKRR